MGKEKQIEERAEKAGVDGGVAQVLQLGAAREHVWSRARQFHIRMHPHSVSHIERLNNQRALRRQEKETNDEIDAGESTRNALNLFTLRVGDQAWGMALSLDFLLRSETTDELDYS